MTLVYRPRWVSIVLCHSWKKLPIRSSIRSKRGQGATRSKLGQEQKLWLKPLGEVARPGEIGCIDTGKNTLHLIGLDEKGAIVLREKVSRGRIAARFANTPRCLIGVEAGMATHYVARELIALGHEVRQVPPAYAKPFRQGHKNDFRDAHAVAEAVQRPSTQTFQSRAGYGRV